MHFYFIGIKGTGMSSLANILVDLGYEVSGADYDKKYFTEATFRKEIKVEKFENCILDKDCFYIIGNAFKLFDLTNEIKEKNYLRIDNTNLSAEDVAKMIKEKFDL